MTGQALSLLSLSVLACFLTIQNHRSAASQSSQLVLSSPQPVLSSFSTCPANPPISCHIPPHEDTVNSCCTNTPGGLMLLTQFWDSHPATGPVDSWTMHGLWPDNCDGTYEASCDYNRQYHNITQILQQGGGTESLEFMKKYWKDQHGNDEQFWEHEWSKHGTCISTLEPHCSGTSYKPQSEVVTFFNRTVQLFKALPTYDWLAAANIIPSRSTTYRLDQLQAVANQRFGRDAVWNCRGHVLNEVWWLYNTIGTIAEGTFLPADPVGPRSTCPHSGIQYLPKTGGGGGGGGHPPKHPNDPSHPNPSRKHFIHVINSTGAREGCLISTGNWYTHGTCASFSVSTQSNGKILELRSRKGPCAFSDADSSFKCAKGLSSEGFSYNGSFLLHDGQQLFYASNVPDGRTQARIIKSKAKNAIQLELAPAY